MQELIRRSIIARIKYEATSGIVNLVKEFLNDKEASEALFLELESMLPTILNECEVDMMPESYFQDRYRKFSAQSSTEGYTKYFNARRKQDSAVGKMLSDEVFPETIGRDNVLRIMGYYAYSPALEGILPDSEGPALSQGLHFAWNNAVSTVVTSTPPSRVAVTVVEDGDAANEKLVSNKKASLCG